MVPGRARIRWPPSSTLAPRQCRATSTRSPSDCDWPERLVPAARKVRGMPRLRLTAKSRCTSSTELANTTASGISR